MTENKKDREKGRKSLFILISILAAAFMWLYVDIENETRVTLHVNDVPVTYQNVTALESKGLMLLEESDQTIDLTFEATRWNVGLLDKSKIRVFADLSDIEATGQKTLTPRVYLPTKPDGYQFSSSDMSLKDSNSYTLSVSIDELFSKTVDIRCKVVGSVAQNYSAEEPILHPTALEIRGQEEVIGPVAYAQVTLEINNATETVRQTLTYQYFDRYGNELPSRGIHANEEEVDVIMPVNVTKDLMLEMNFIEAPGASKDNITYTITPNKIRVTGDAAKLKDITTLTLDDFELLSLRDGIATYIYTIPVPEGCENLSDINRATLNIAFRDMQTVVLPAGRIVYENYPEGKHIEVLTENVNVTFFGTSADLAEITEADITVTADLSDFGEAAGMYTVPARVEIDTDGDVGIAGTYQVRVNISEPEGNEPEQGVEDPNDTNSNG